MSNPIEDIAIQCLEEKDAKIAELEALVASLRQQLKVARDTLLHQQNIAQRPVHRWGRDEYDYLDYEDDRR